MQRVMFRAKIHRATVTDANLDYVGSCGIDPVLMEAAGIIPGEQLHIVNVTNGSRAITYAIEGAPGAITLNGAMAHIGSVGDTVIIICYAHIDESEARTFQPTIVQVDSQNRIREQVAVS